MRDRVWATYGVASPLSRRVFLPAFLGCCAAALLYPPAASAAISDGANAIDALGQYDENASAPSPVYTKSAVNNGPNQFGLNTPYYGIALDSTNDRLFVAEISNNRVVVYNLNADDSLADHIPDAVLGQANFYSDAGAATQSGMFTPSGFAYDNASTPKRLFGRRGATRPTRSTARSPATRRSSTRPARRYG